MESFPSKAIRAFDKPMTFYYAPETGSFVIDGYVNSQKVQIIAGPAATAKDESPAIILSSEKMSAAEMSEIVTNDLRIRSYYKKSSTVLDEHIHPWARFDSHNDVLISDHSLGEFIINNISTLVSFVGKDAIRPQLQRVNLALSETTDLVATDGHRLQVVGIEQSYLSEYTMELDIAIPAKILSALKLHTCLGFICTTDLTCSLTCFSEEYDVITISWVCAREDFPKWKNVIPSIEEESVLEVEHCIPMWGKLPASVRKKDMTFHLLVDEQLDIYAPFGILDGSDLVYLGETEADPSTLQCWMTLLPKYAWEIGKCVKKVNIDDIKLFAYFTEDGPDRSKPMRIDWVSGDVQYTHVLMPKRDPGSWESAMIG